MSTLWKVKREAKRTGQQIRALLESVYEPYLTRRHDRIMAGALPIKGQVAVSKKIAIHLIFQPNGLNPDIISNCDFLRKAGYAPFVIANGGLSDSDIARLIPHAWQILSRPNFGYDFGGYRDGVLSILKSELDVKHLVIINDSVLFPVTGNMDFLDKAEASTFDISGGIIRYRHGDIKYLESYFFALSADTLKNPAFQRFWQDYIMTSNKFKVVRRGERGFSYAMNKAGVSLGPLYSNDAFLTRIGQESPPILRLCMQYCAFHYPDKNNAEAQHLLAQYQDSPVWKQQILDFMTRVLQKDVFKSAFCFGAVHLLGYPFLKKSPDLVCVAWRKAYIAAVIAGDLPQPPKAIMDMLEKGD